MRSKPTKPTMMALWTLFLLMLMSACFLSAVFSVLEEIKSPTETEIAPETQNIVEITSFSASFERKCTFECTETTILQDRRGNHGFTERK